jgi:hypothetical protein
LMYRTDKLAFFKFVINLFKFSLPVSTFIAAANALFKTIASCYANWSYWDNPKLGTMLTD